MRVIECVNNYLLENDFVRIPNLGYFYYEEVSSSEKLDKRILSFDYNDQEKKSLLIDYVSAEYKCSYNESLKLIFEFVKEVKNQLRKEGFVLIDNLGYLLKEKEHIVFHDLSDFNNLLIPQKNRTKKRNWQHIILTTILFLAFFSVVF
ncbi:MAG: hypothetical protein ACK5HU_04385, partial [Flavobacteriales bacterium]